MPSTRAQSVVAVGLAVKPVGKPDAGNPHVRFDERGRETGQCHRARPRLYRSKVVSDTPLWTLMAGSSNCSSTWFVCRIGMAPPPCLRRPAAAGLSSNSPLPTAPMPPSASKTPHALPSRSCGKSQVSFEVRPRRWAELTKGSAWRSQEEGQRREPSAALPGPTATEGSPRVSRQPSPQPLLSSTPHQP